MSRKPSNLNRPLAIGTRSSKLALIQTQEVLERFHALYPNVKTRIVPIHTSGDSDQFFDLTKSGDGIFVQEIERALIDGEIDLAVHSLKDLPTQSPAGLIIGAITQRLDPRDVLVSHNRIGFNDLPSGARIGTSSPRRAAEIMAIRKDLEVVPLRGNIDTRIRAVMKGQSYDACVLASAGLIRAGLQDHITSYLLAEEFIPAPGQAALAIELRKDDTHLLGMLSSLDHPNTRRCVTAERAFIGTIASGCNIPVGAYAKIDGTIMALYVFIGLIDGSHNIRVKVTGSPSNPHQLAQDAYESLVERGGRTLLETIRALLL